MKKLVFRLVLFALVALTFEFGAYVMLEILRLKGYLYEVPGKPGNLDYATRLRVAHPVLGWPLKEGKDAPGGLYRDKTGARRLPAFPDPDATPSCISLYGDSFVESVEQDYEHAAANVLARAIGCRVANFGQAAYGTDQAFLRYQMNPLDKSATVVLGHMLENILRNINRNRDLLTGGLNYGVKPRFILDPGGRLVLVPLPNLSEEEYAQSVGIRSPLLLLEHESFQPGGALVAAPAHFPYLLSLLHSLGNYTIRARVHGNRPRYAEFYQPDHPTHALEVTTAIVDAFRDETVRRGQRGVVLLLPPYHALEYHARTGEWIHQPLVDRLKQAGIPYLDFGPYFVAHRDQDIEAYFAASLHYNQRGDALWARMLAEALGANATRGK